MSGAAVQQFDISVVVTAHAEGRLAHRTMRSVQAAVDEANQHGVRSEIIVVLDDPTAETLAYFSNWSDRARVLEVSNRDPGLSRNAAIAEASGKYISMVEANQLLGKTWLQEAYKWAEQAQQTNFIVHPQYTLYMDKWNLWSQHYPSTAARFRRADLLSSFPWGSSLFAPRSTFEKVPFDSTPVDCGFCCDHWHWVCNVLALGGKVEIAPGTCTFHRQEPKGWQPSANNNRPELLRTSTLFDPRKLPDTAISNAATGDRPAGAPNSSESTATGPLSLRERVLAFPREISRATEKYPFLQKTLGAVYRAVVRKPDLNEVLPDWLMQQWREIAEIEPAFFPSREIQAQMWFTEPATRPWVGAYDTICTKLAAFHRDVEGPQFTHIYLVPRLKRGGTDRVTINFVLLTASNPANRVLVIATDEPDSPWKVRLPDNVAFLNFYESSHRLARDDKKQLLVNLLIQLHPQVIHNIYSLLGNQVYALFGRALSRIARLYAPAYCVEVESDGKPVGEVISFLPGHAEYLTAVISDNQHILNWLEEKYAIDPTKLFVHYQPVILKELTQRKTRKPGDPLHVLWAGRLDRQKHPEIMVEIARRCQSDDIHFHVYGSNVLTIDKAQVDFSQSPNVSYHGEFDGLCSLPTEQYDVFLNTSEWEGMPNILLEAVGEGLPIVASNVGGVSELIVQDETGMIVAPFGNVEQYVHALLRLKADPEFGERMMLASRRLVAERHSWQHFADELNRLPGYLEHPCLLDRAELSRLEMPIPATMS